MLTGLADDSPAFARHVRLLSAVSGGSVGVMHYLTQDSGCAPDDGASAGKSSNTSMPTSRDAALEHAMESSLHAAGWGLAYQDLPRTVVPFLTSPLLNRGQLLEDAWKRDPRLASPVDSKKPAGSPALLSSWAVPVARGRCPGAVFNAMVAETGEPMLFSIAPLPRSLARFEFRRHYPKLDVRLTTAVRLSAAFPYVSPATRAQHDEDPMFARDVPPDRKEPRYNHIVDGGYFDNFGLATAAEWLHGELLALEKAGKLPRRVLLLEICEESSCSTDSPTEQPAFGGERRTLAYQLYAPLAALYQMRGAAQRARNRWHVSLLKKAWAPKVEIVSAPFAYPSQAGPLSWHLTERQKQEVRDAWCKDRIVQQRQAVATFLEPTKPASLTTCVARPEEVGRTATAAPLPGFSRSPVRSPRSR